MFCLKKQRDGARIYHIDIPPFYNTSSRAIPNVIYMATHIKLKNVPDLLKKTADSYEVCIYNDKSARDFLKQVWGERILKRFDRLKLDAHKMDLWRYCMLYIHGGVYLDIKTIPITNIEDVFSKENTWYTCLSANRGCYQGIIATPPENHIILDCIRQIMRTSDGELASNYLLLTSQMHDTCRKVYKSLCDVPGEYTTSWGDNMNVPKLVLFRETCSDIECQFTTHDRYGKCCNIRDEHMKHLFRTRHGNYPWKKLPLGEQSILKRPNLKIMCHIPSKTRRPIQRKTRNYSKLLESNCGRQVPDSVSASKDQVHGFSTKLHGEMYYTMNWAYIDEDTYVMRLTRLPPNSIVQTVRADPYMFVKAPSEKFDSYIVRVNDWKEVTFCQPVINGSHKISSNGFEDPRLFAYRNKSYVICSFRGTFRRKTRHWQVIYEANKPEEYWVCPGLMWIEKNWTPFEHEGKLLCVYMISPHKICELTFANDNMLEFEMLHSTVPRIVLEYKLNQVGGGAPPIFVPELDAYMSIAHWKVNRDVSRSSMQYYNFAYIFEKMPPFAIINLTGLSAQIPSLIEFMTGIQMTDSEFIVSTGIDDSRSVLCRFNRRTLCDSLRRGARRASNARAANGLYSVPQD